MNHITVMKQALDALESVEGIALLQGIHRPSFAINALRAAIAQPEIEPTIKESLKVHASAEDYLRHTYGAYRGHFAWRELEEAYSQGRCDESMAQGPIPWPVHRPGTVGIDE